MLQKKIVRSILGMGALAVMLWVGPGIKAEAADGTHTDDQHIVYILDEDDKIAIVSNGRQAEGEITIPRIIECDGISYTVIAINAHAFDCYENDNTLITKVIIPDSVTSIGVNAFNRCTNLGTVEIKGAASIAYGAFCECNNLENVTMNLVVAIDFFAFARCLNLKNISMNSVTSIGESAFLNCTSLTNITLPNTLIDISDSAFSGCTNLEKITVNSQEMKDKMDEYKENNDFLKAEIIFDKSAENPKPSTSTSSKPTNTYTPPAWLPTPDHIYRASCVEKSAPTYTLSQVDYGFRLENTMQGPLCFDVFNAARGEYTIGRTYSAYMNDTLVSDLPEAVTVTMKIPESLQKENREFIMICEHHGGQSTILKDLDENPDTITFTVKECYAFALCYVD